MKRVIFGCFLFYLGVYGYGFKVYVKYPFAIDSRLRDTVVVDSLCRNTPVEITLNNQAKGLSIVDSVIGFYQDSFLSNYVKDNNRLQIEDKDTIKDSNPSFWRRLSYSIGYSGGLCWRGRDLIKSSSGWDVMPWLHPSNYLYLLHSIELSAIYPLEGERGIEVGVGFGYSRLEDTQGLGDCNLSKLNLFLLKGSKSAKIGIEMAMAKTVSDWWSLENEEYQITRFYIGGGGTV